MDFFVWNAIFLGTRVKEGCSMKREFATYEVTGYDDLVKIKFVHLREVRVAS